MYKGVISNRKGGRDQSRTKGLISSRKGGTDHSMTKGVISSPPLRLLIAPLVIEFVYPSFTTTDYPFAH
jgi:hypothetical protein